MNRETYTKVFLAQTNEALTDANIKAKMRLIWKNNRRGAGGLRLTDAGLLYLTTVLNLAAHEVDFPVDLDLKPDVLLYLDKFIDCPYHLTEKAITVFSEKKAFELHLFAGDVRKYGLIKAKRREKIVPPTTQNPLETWQKPLTK